MYIKKVIRKDKYHFLTVLSRRSETVVSKYGNKRSNVVALCRCDCGKDVSVVESRLRSGNTKSCGCYNRQLLTNRQPKNKKHGLSKTVEYHTWSKMKSRCYKITSKSYKWYGAKGITVCDRWLNSFENFLLDMGVRPTKNHSIERKNYDEGYCPENCVWATAKEQRRNQHNVIKIIYNGEERKLIEICEEFKVSSRLIWRRMQCGLSFDLALNTPKFGTYKGAIKTNNYEKN